MMSRAADTAGSRPRTPSAAGTGAILRAVLSDPRRGFAAGAASARRSAREGATAVVLAAFGGAAAMLLWLKFGALVGVRGGGADFRWGYLMAALAVGGVGGVLTQRVWGRLAVGAGSERTPAELRSLWGLACLPQVVSVLILLPADIALAGPAAFTAQPFSGRLATLWTAVSMAVAASIALWSGYLFVTGLAVVTKQKGIRRMGSLVVAAASAMLVTGGIVLTAVLVSRLG